MINLLTSQYVLILYWIGFVALAAKFIKLTKKETVIGYDGEVERYYWLFAFIAVLPVILIAGYRMDTLFDTAAYTMSFKAAPDTLSELPDYLSVQEKDIGFGVFQVIIKTFFTQKKTTFLVIIAVIQGIFVCIFYRKYSSRYFFSLFLFVASTDYITWMFGGIRQFLAVTIIVLATPLLLKKKYIPLILVILFASTFHQSALMMLPVIFIVQGEAWNKRTLFFIVIVLAAIFFVGNFTTLLNDVLADTQYKNVVSNYQKFGDNGTNPIRVLVYSVPTVLAFFYRKRIREKNNKLINICVNMSIVSTGLYIVSMFTSGIFLGRLPIYTSLYNYILLPYELDLIFDGKDQRFRTIMYIITCVFYLAYYYYLMHFVNWLV